MAGTDLVDVRPGTTVEIEGFQYYRLTATIPDDSFAFVAKPIKVRTRKGKDYHVVRITVPKNVMERLMPAPDDYLFLRAKIAQWFHMVNWAKMPKVWEKLPGELQSQVLASNVFSPTVLATPSGVVGYPALAAATRTTVPSAVISQTAMEARSKEGSE